jgi:hypothetical protein
MSQQMRQVFAGRALEAVLAAARRPPSNEDSLADESSLGGLKRSFVTQVAENAGNPNSLTSTGNAIPRPTQFAAKLLF